MKTWNNHTVYKQAITRVKCGIDMPVHLFRKKPLHVTVSSARQLPQEVAHADLLQ